MILPKIYPITDAGLTTLSHTEQIKRLILGGAEFIQLREKNAPADSFYNDALSALNQAGLSNVKLIINDRVDIALAAGAAGVHLGQNDLPPAEARKILGDDAIIGYSTHDHKQAREAVKLPVDYIAIGPVFETSTKSNPDPTVGLEMITRIRETVKDFPLVAIGGITLENCRAVIDAGADSLAVIGGLLLPAEKITETYKKFVLEVNH
ncbi:MAG: thiamine phosphate synthase [Pyrinomonadaceae bacterium]